MTTINSEEGLDKMSITTCTSTFFFWPLSSLFLSVKDVTEPVAPCSADVDNGRIPTSGVAVELTAVVSERGKGGFFEGVAIACSSEEEMDGGARMT